MPCPPLREGLPRGAGDRRRQVAHDQHRFPGQRTEVARIGFLDREDRVRPIERLPFLLPRGRKPLARLTLRLVKPIAVGEHIERVDQLEHAVRHGFE
jgi:hypothetical protein